MKLLSACLIAATLWLIPVDGTAADAAKKPEPTLEQRVGDLEAYVNNGPRATDGKAESRIAGPGPGHSAWMMTSAALVLFMTLPGLALFYGGWCGKRTSCPCWRNVWDWRAWSASCGGRAATA